MTAPTRAEQEGRDAYAAGVPQHDNPYEAAVATAAQRLDWLSGWLAAEGEAARRGNS